MTVFELKEAAEKEVGSQMLVALAVRVIHLSDALELLIDGTKLALPKNRQSTHNIARAVDIFDRWNSKVELNLK